MLEEFIPFYSELYYKIYMNILHVTGKHIITQSVCVIGSELNIIFPLRRLRNFLTDMDDAIIS
jgi:hypothetical protein